MGSAVSDITIVTAFFDVGRGRIPARVNGRPVPAYQRRSNETYFEYFNMLAAMKNDMVVFTQPEFLDAVLEIREKHGLADKTEVVVYADFDFEEYYGMLERMNAVMQSEEYISKIDNPELIEYWNAPYNLINYMKSHFCTHAIELGLVNTEKVAWIDFGYCRSMQTLSSNCEWDYDFDKDKIHLFNLKDINPDRPVENIIKTGDVYIMGCHIVAGTHMWPKLKELVFGNANKLLDQNLVDDDQTIMLLSYLEKPELFELHPVDPSNWFIIFNKFNTAI